MFNFSSKVSCFLSLSTWALLQPIYSQVVTTIKITNPTTSAKATSDLTFGMVFKPGDVPSGKSLSASVGTLQVDAKAIHADGSLRHAILSIHLDNLTAGETKTVQLSQAPVATPTIPIDAAAVLKTAFDATVTVTLAGAVYTASVRDYLAGTTAKSWLSGSQCTEWLVSAPLKNSAGAIHPLLSARFAIRAYAGLKNIRADVTVENAWAFEPNPSGLTYDAKIQVGADNVYTKAALGHTHHARWRRVLWWGGDPTTDYAYDQNYLLSTGAFPFYDAKLKVSEAAITALKTDYDPMANGDLSDYMPETGAHTDIGPLPNFGALYLLSMSPRARLNVLANGNCGGSYQIHYRNKTSDRPVTLDEYPYMTLLGNTNDTRNPKTGKLEAFPDVVNPLNVFSPDDSHQPSIGFLPYVISGDYFYLEELQFWANWNMIIANPGYRQEAKGLLMWGQVRAQAWSMRTLGQAAYITPDTHALKKYFNEKILNNIDWYTNDLVKDPTATDLGYLEGHYAYEPFGISPWMDNFFTWSMGYLNALGFNSVKPLAIWKAKFVVGTIMDPGYCWLEASTYSLQVGTAAKVPYKTFGEMYKANFPTPQVCTGVKMSGYPDEATGYGANMQPALAMSVDVGAPNAKEAWAKYETRVPKQDYTSQPQWDVVPGGLSVIAIRPQFSAQPKLRTFSAKLAMPGSTLVFDVATMSDVVMELFNTAGQKLYAISLGRKNPGTYTVDWARLTEGRDFVFGAKPCLVRFIAKDESHQRAFLGSSVEK
jgi:hypothetical protein